MATGLSVGYEYEEYDALDERWTKTTPEIDPVAEGPFIKHRNMMVILDNLSAEYLASKMLTTKLSPTEIISNMIRRELSLTEIDRN